MQQLHELANEITIHLVQVRPIAPTTRSLAFEMCSLCNIATHSTTLSTRSKIDMRSTCSSTVSRSFVYTGRTVRMYVCWQLTQFLLSKSIICNWFGGSRYSTNDQAKGTFLRHERYHQRRQFLARPSGLRANDRELKF